MKKLINLFTLLLGVFIILFAGCSTTKKLAVKPNEHMEIGWTPRSVFQSPPYAAWFDTTYEKYVPNEDVINKLKNMKQDIEIVVVYATWCGDSKRELPRFFKIMDAIQFPPEKITLIAVDRTMEIPQGIKKTYEIKAVPTFIIKYYGLELNRIIENPKKTLEEDLLDTLEPVFQ